MSERRVPEDLLLDSAASLRIADRIVRELGDADPMDIDDPASAAALPDVLLRACTEIISILESLHRSRSILEQSAMDRLQQTHERLREVSSATEVAATDLLDGLDRALLLVDDLDEDSGEVRDELRSELFRVISCLQVQDIAAQQLGHASTVLEDIDQRLTSLVRLIDQSLPDARTREPGAPLGHDAFPHDPQASTEDAATRQAVAHEIFVRKVG